MQDEFRSCKKCLTRDMIDKDEYFATLKELIDNVRGEKRTPKPMYEERLSTCLKCEKLADGMCRGCGCYVELRAAIIDNHCPYSEW